LELTKAGYWHVEGNSRRGHDAPSSSAAIAHVRALLRSSDCDAAEAFLVLETALAGSFDQPRLDALSAAIREFDFDGALLKLDEIAKEHVGIESIQK
jgi:hypothetical protein